MLKKYEFMENVLDSQIYVLLERQKTFDEGDWVESGRKQKEYNDKRNS
ncbi:MAG: hypothetical protein ACK52J_05145 [bacterium]|jgi:hypothetical protein